MGNLSTSAYPCESTPKYCSTYFTSNSYESVQGERVVLACRTIQYTADTCVISLYDMSNKCIVHASGFETKDIFWKTFKGDNDDSTCPFYFLSSVLNYHY